MSLASLLAAPLTKKFLQDGDVYLALQDAAALYEIPDDRMGELLDVTDAAIDGQISLSDIPGLLQEAFALSEADAKKLAIDVVKIRLLPLGDFLPGVEEQVKAWGGVAGEMVKKVGKEEITATAFAERLADRAGLEFSDLLVKRLAFLLEQRVNNQKTDESLRTFFGRPLTIGGMGLTKEQIDALMNVVTPAVTGVRIISDEEKVAREKAAKEEAQKQEEKGVVAAIPAQSSVQAGAPSMALEIAPVHDVAAEVPVISSPVQEARREAAAAKPLVMNIAQPAEEKPDVQDKKRAEKAKKLHEEAIKTAFKDAIDIALEKGKDAVVEAQIAPAAWADIAGKMLRGVRDQYQTRDVLERDYKVKPGALPKLLEVLLESEEVYRVAVSALTVAEESTTISEGDAQALEDAEAKRLDEKFVALTKEAVKPEKAVVELTVGSVAPVNDATQKRVTDVVPGNKLMGPVEQLGTLTLADFRRLSTNPEEAVRKMEALLLALQKTSYEDRVQGLLAWRKSPLAKLYVTLMTESLNTGVAVAEIAARRRAQGQESLGPAEMQALAKWNEKTRF